MAGETEEQGQIKLIDLEPGDDLWDRFFTVAPIVLVGTREEDGSHDLAPKHMVVQLGWEEYFGFVCTPSHRTYQNIGRTGEFTVSYPRPSQVLLASLAAVSRCTDGSKPSLAALETFPASQVDGVLVKDANLYFECRLDRIVEGFGENVLIAGKIVAARIREGNLRGVESDDADLIHASPMFVYLNPGRFASVQESLSFPFPSEFKK